MKKLYVTTCISLMALSIINATRSFTSTNPLTIKKIIKTSSTTNDVTHYDFVVSSGEAIKDIQYIILALRIDVGGSIKEIIYENTEVHELPASVDTYISYQVATEPLGSPMQVFITAHDNNAEDLAFVLQGFQLQDIEPSLTWVGADSGTGHKDSLRIGTNIPITLDGKNCTGPSCYFLHYNNTGDFLEVCTKAKNETGGLTDILQCDTTLTIEDSGELTSVRSIQLTYPKATSNDDTSMIVSAEYEDNSTKMEVVLYTGKDMMSLSSCSLYSGDTNDIKNCTLPKVTVNTTEGIFNILMVTLGENDEVIKSTSIDFEDYKPQPISITPDIIYLTFSAKDKTTYKVYLDKEVPDGYRDVKVICGGDEVDKCTTYFLDLQHTTYVVSVKKNERGDLNIVEGTVTMISEEDPMICYPQDDEESSRNKSKEMMQLTHRQKEE